MNTFIKKDTASLPELVIPFAEDLPTALLKIELSPDTEIKKAYCAADAWRINNRKRMVRVYPRRT